MTKILVVVLVLPLIVLLTGVVSLIVAWPAMLFVGNANIASAGAVPTLGYWPVFWLTWALSLVTTRGTTSR